MNTTTSLLARCSSLIAMAALITGSAHCAERARAPKAKVAFIAADVTIDGTLRPDIGRALADSLCAGALKRGTYRVFSLEQLRAPRAKSRYNGGAMLGSSLPGLPAVDSANDNGMPGDLDYLFAFSLVGEGDHYQFTLKKVRALDQEVLEAHELNAAGRMDKIFGLVPQVLARLEDSSRSPVFPRSQSPAEVRAAEPVVPHVIVPPAPRYLRPGTWSGLPQEYAQVDLNKVPKALVYRRVGSIMTTNDPWRFAIIRPAPGTGLYLNDSLHVLWDHSGGVYANLNVANFDGGKVIADYGGLTPAYHKLFSGDAVYGWATPLY